MYQSQRLVVQQDNFHIQVMFGSGRHFLNIHHDAAIAGKTQHFAIGFRQRRTNCRWQAKAHRP
ncbi:hypothetical protein D3C75_581380 [compost metagenome]